MNGISILSDTNPLIYLLDGNKEVAEYLDEKQVWISVISELELFGKSGLTNTEVNEINLLLKIVLLLNLHHKLKAW